MKTTLTRIVTGISCAILTTSLTLPVLAAEAPAKPEAASASISFTCALPEAETATEAAGVTYNADGTINVPTDDSVKYIPKDGTGFSATTVLSMRSRMPAATTTTCLRRGR